jgi:hypothetical protein
VLTYTTKNVEVRKMLSGVMETPPAVKKGVLQISSTKNDSKAKLKKDAETSCDLVMVNMQR